MEGRWTDGCTDGRTESLSILQDFISCRGRCPATFCDFTTSKKQGKGTADPMMPFGNWFRQGPRQVTKSCRLGRNSVHMSIHTCPRGLPVRPSGPSDKPSGPSVRLSGPQARLASPQAPLSGPQALLAGPKAPLAGPKAPLAGLRPLWLGLTLLAGPQTPLAGPH